MQTAKSLLVRLMLIPSGIVNPRRQLRLCLETQSPRSTCRCVPRKTPDVASFWRNKKRSGKLIKLTQGACVVSCVLCSRRSVVRCVFRPHKRDNRGKRRDSR
jgi:hypothetical protein